MPTPKKIQALSVQTIHNNKEQDLKPEDLAKLTAMVRKSQRIPFDVLFKDPMKVVRAHINQLAEKSPKSTPLATNHIWTLVAENSGARDNQKQQEQHTLAHSKQ